MCPGGSLGPAGVGWAGLGARTRSPSGRDGGQEEKGMTEDEIAGWHHWLNGHELE